MANKKPKTIAYRRRREQKTNYGKRLRLLLSKKLRLAVRFTNQKVIAQCIEFHPEGDKVLFGVDSSALKELGWKHSCKNMPAAYLTGLLFAKNAVKKEYTQAILDTGKMAPLKKMRVFAFVKGALDGGFQIPIGEGDIFPDEKRIMGQHIGEYLKNDITQSFKEVKRKLSI